MISVRTKTRAIILSTLLICSKYSTIGNNNLFLESAYAGNDRNNTSAREIKEAKEVLLKRCNPYIEKMKKIEKLKKEEITKEIRNEGVEACKVIRNQISKLKLAYGGTYKISVEKMDKEYIEPIKGTITNNKVTVILDCINNSYRPHKKSELTKGGKNVTLLASAEACLDSIEKKLLDNSSTTTQASGSSEDANTPGTSNQNADGNSVNGSRQSLLPNDEDLTSVYSDSDLVVEHDSAVDVKPEDVAAPVTNQPKNQLSGSSSVVDSNQKTNTSDDDESTSSNTSQNSQQDSNLTTDIDHDAASDSDSAVDSNQKTNTSDDDESTSSNTSQNTAEESKDVEDIAEDDLEDDDPTGGQQPLSNSNPSTNANINNNNRNNTSHFKPIFHSTIHKSRTLISPQISRKVSGNNRTSQQAVGASCCNNIRKWELEAKYLYSKFTTPQANAKDESSTHGILLNLKYQLNQKLTVGLFYSPTFTNHRVSNEANDNSLEYTDSSSTDHMVGIYTSYAITPITYFTNQLAVGTTSVENTKNKDQRYFIIDSFVSHKININATNTTIAPELGLSYYHSNPHTPGESDKINNISLIMGLKLQYKYKYKKVEFVPTIKISHMHPVYSDIPTKIQNLSSDIQNAERIDLLRDFQSSFDPNSSIRISLAVKHRCIRFESGYGYTTYHNSEQGYAHTFFTKFNFFF